MGVSGYPAAFGNPESRGRSNEGGQVDRCGWPVLVQVATSVDLDKLTLSLLRAWPSCHWPAPFPQYLNLIRDLASLVNVKELTGMQTVKYLPRDEREKIGIQRQKDLELLFDKLNKLKNRLRRKEELLEEYDKDVGPLRYRLSPEARIQLSQVDLPSDDAITGAHPSGPSFANLTPRSGTC